MGTHLSVILTMSYHCCLRPLSRSHSKPGTHVLWNRDHICSSLIFLWPHFHWCWIESIRVWSRECWILYMCVHMLHWSSQCLGHSVWCMAHLHIHQTIKIQECDKVHRHTKLLDCFEVLCADILWIWVVPPDSQPDYLASKAFYATMPMKAKPQPLIMLFHHPEVVDPSYIECMTDKLVCQSLGHQIRLHKLEIPLYYIPLCCIVSI